MRKEKILIVEDDDHISRLLQYNLEKAGYKCMLALKGENALSLLNRENVDCIILDIMLPEMDGLEVCRKIKQKENTASIPIIILTAKGEEVDRIVGLELGADDYVVKPFSTRELVLRVKSILRRTQSKENVNDILTVEDLKLNIPKHRVSLAGKKIELTQMEFKLLLTLMRRRGRLQSRERLLNDIWEINSEVATRTVDTHIKRLRKKLGEKGELIETVRGLGYRFKEEE